MFLVNKIFIKLNINNTSVYLITVGFFSILGQVVLLRELNVAFYGIELIYILSFGFWLIGTAIGAAAGRRSFIPKEKNIQFLFIISSAALIIDIPFIRSIRKIFGGVEGGYLPFTIQIIGLIIALIPISFFTGLLFQWTAKRFANENETLAKAYSIESAGGVLGGLCSTLFLDLGINNFLIALICSFASASISIYFLWKKEKKLQKVLSLIWITALIFLFGLSCKIDLMMTSWNHPYLVESIDTPYSRVTITSTEKQICVFEDDALSYETESVSAEEFVQLSTLQLNNFNNVLVLGGGFEGIIYELLKLPVRKIDYVEINKKMVEVLQKQLPDYLCNSLKNKKVNIIYTDPRKFLKTAHSYNLILVGMPEPTSAQINRFYTKEFFAQCYKALSYSGVLAFKVRSSENLWTKQLIERNKGIYNALKPCFENVLVLPGVIFIASNSELTSDVNLLTNRFNERRLETKLITPRYINYIFTNDRFFEIQKLLAEQSKYINSDLQPICYIYTISIWLSKFFPNLAYSENPLTNFNAYINRTTIVFIILFSLGIILTARKFIQLQRFILVFSAGFIGMILEIILILLYQTKNGILYRDIGLLLTAFMVGLSFGAFIVNKFYALSTVHRNNQKHLGILLSLCLLLLSIVVFFLIKIDLMSGLFLISTSLFFDGIFVAGIFSFASLNKVENQHTVISQLYAADLIGGSLGSIVASLIFVPAFGLLTTALIMAVIAALSIILVL